MENALICQFQLRFLIGYRQVRHPSQGREEVLFGIWVVDGPPRLDEPMGTGTAKGPVFHARHMELGSRMKLSLWRGLVYKAASIPYLAAGDSGHEAEDQSGRGCERYFPALLPSVTHVQAIPSSFSEGATTLLGRMAASVPFQV